jgi:hypothetical protein
MDESIHNNQPGTNKTNDDNDKKDFGLRTATMSDNNQPGIVAVVI